MLKGGGGGIMSYQLQMDSCGYEERMHYIIQRHVRLIVLVLDKERLGGGGSGTEKCSLIMITGFIITNK